MKMPNPLRTTVSLLAGLVLVASCSLGLPGTAAGKAKPQATVKIGIPAVSPLLSGVLAKAGARTLAPRAMMFATWARIDIYDSTNTTLVISSGDLVPTQSGPGYFSDSSFMLDVGSTYWARVQVKNQNGDPLNVLSGQANFTVYSGGGNYVSVTLVPGSPIPMLGSSAQFSLMETGYNPSAGFTLIGGESWYRFTAPSEVASITITPTDPAGVVYFGLYDTSGNSLGSGISSTFMGMGTDSAAALVTGLTATSDYLLGLIQLVDTTSGTPAATPVAGSIAIADVSASHHELDVEPNDTPQTAQVVEYPSVTQVQGTAWDADYYKFQPTSSGPMDIWFGFQASTFGSMEILDPNGNSVASVWGHSSSGQENFYVSLDVQYPNQFYTIKGNFQGRSQLGFPIPAGTDYTLHLGEPAPWALAASMNLGDDLSSYSWTAFGGSIGGYTDLMNGLSWRLDGNYSSYFQVILPVDPTAGSYKLVWQTSAWYHQTYVDVYVNSSYEKGYYGDYLTASSFQEIPVQLYSGTPPSSLTVRFQDNNSDPNAVFDGTALWIYQLP